MQPTTWVSNMNIKFQAPKPFPSHHFIVTELTSVYSLYEVQIISQIKRMELKAHNNI